MQRYKKADHIYLVDSSLSRKRKTILFIKKDKKTIEDVGVGVGGCGCLLFGHTRTHTIKW